MESSEDAEHEEEEGERRLNPLLYTPLDSFGSSREYRAAVGVLRDWLDKYRGKTLDVFAEQELVRDLRENAPRDESGG